MSNYSETALLSKFPEPMCNSKSIYAMATAAARELDLLYRSGNYVELYTRIDELSKPLLDILANDFKVDWYDPEYSLESKRETLKKAWEIHRIIGTPAAVSLAFSALYDSARIEEWYEYGGQPYHYGLSIDTGEKFPDHEILVRLLERIRYYTNLRSKLDHVEFSTEKNENVFFGVALQSGNHYTLECSGAPSTSTYLTDENGNRLTDENGIFLIL